MPPKKQKENPFRVLAEGIRRAATRPNVFGYNPHEKQLPFHQSQAKGRLFLGGNRSGKTVGGATESVWNSTGKHPWRRVFDPPTRGRVVSVDFLNGVEKIVRPEIARWMPASELRGGHWDSAYDKELRTLHLSNGSFIEFMSYDQELDKFAGTSRHWTWFDEEPPKAVFTECKARLIDTGGSWWMTMTPVEGMTWTFDDIYEKRFTDPDIDVFEVDMTDNPYLNDVEIQSFISGLSKDEVVARVRGRYVQRAGVIYRYFSEMNILDPMIPPLEWMHVRAMDHGFNNPTCWLWAAVSPDGTIIIYDEHYEAGQIVAYHARRVHEKTAQNGRPIAYSVGDPSIKNVDPITGTSVLLEYMEHGVPIILGNNDVRAGINRVARYIGSDEQPRRLYVTRNCVNFLWEIKRYRWALWAQKHTQHERDKKEDPHKKDDHAMDAARYLVASRPEHDQGTEIPVSTGPMGAPVGILDPNMRKDEGMRTFTSSYDLDYTLGSEY